MTARTDRISGKEHEVLKLIASGHDDGPELARITRRSPEGLHQTAASLVRKGWLYREQRPTRYSLTSAGTVMLARCEREPDLVR